MDDWVLACRNVEVAGMRCRPCRGRSRKTWREGVRDDMNMLGNHQCSICQGLGVQPPYWCLSTPNFLLTPTGLVNNSQKYIADPLWFYYKSEYWKSLKRIAKRKEFKCI